MSDVILKHYPEVIVEDTVGGRRGERLNAFYSDGRKDCSGRV